ncbi:MAG: hypothetical protein FJX76_18810 [Armatimonadetes bacterium]|nr:hypothetical protein [Armatimonadota bacterium]
MRISKIQRWEYAHALIPPREVPQEESLRPRREANRVNGPSYEIRRSFEVFNYLSRFPAEVQVYIRRRMREVLRRDRIVADLHFKDLVRQKAVQFGGEETAESWHGRTEEAKKQLTDLYFAANYSLDYLKYLVAEHSPEMETAFGIPTPSLLDFSVNLEKADVDIIIKKMYAFEQLSGEERLNAMPEMQELKIVLIRRLISEQFEFVRVAHKFLSIGDIHRLYDRIVGSGRVGGKSAGMLLAYRILVTPEPGDPFDFAKYFKIPNSYYVGDDVFHSFLDYNGMLNMRNQKFKDLETIEDEYPQIREKILHGHFPVSLWKRLEETIEALGDRPIIVRSSSLLEDNFGLSFAGKYDSFFLANQGTARENLDALVEAIKKIYAGVFSPNAMAYRLRNEIIFRYESMAILIQEVEGKRQGPYFLPDLAGVLFSENPYCWSKRIQKADGMLRLVHGLGTRAVDRVGEDYPRIVALGQPTLRPEAYADLERNSQKYVDVIDLEAQQLSTIHISDVADQGLEGRHAFIMSVKKDDRIQESFTTVDLHHGKPIITFDRLLGRTRFSAVLRAAMQKIRRHYGIELDVEMAAQLTPNGEFTITMLQCRPQSLRVEQMPAELPQVPPEDVVFSCDREVPSGRVDDIRYLVYVDPDTYARIESLHDRYEIARIVGRINQAVEQHAAILLGPGRWGSSNILLGVPVKYYEINNFKLLGEIARASNGAAPEVSYGTHFFQDLVEAGIHCLPIYPGQPGVIFNEDFLNKSHNVLERFVPAEVVAKFQPVVRVIDMHDGPLLQVRMNGKTDQALCFRGSKEA